MRDRELAILRARASEEALTLLERALAPPFDRARFLAAFAGAGRRFGHATIETSEGTRRLSDLARGWVLGAALEALDPREHLALVEELYLRGDNDERQAVLRALAGLPAPARFLAVGVEACRSHVEPVFFAIACHNPFPAAHFPELAFNQMVLKALSLGAPARAIAGLVGRKNPELSRMARALASERAAAGRAVPEDLPLVIGADP